MYRRSITARVTNQVNEQIKITISSFDIDAV